jgi:hypothetical protein
MTQNAQPNAPDAKHVKRTRRKINSISNAMFVLGEPGRCTIEYRALPLFAADRARNKSGTVPETLFSWLMVFPSPASPRVTFNSFTPRSPQRLLNPDKQLPRYMPPRNGVKQINTAVSLLQPIETDTRPRNQRVAEVA